MIYANYIKDERNEKFNWIIEPASRQRDWMDATNDNFAYRCLPMTLANQAGWVIRTPDSFAARWNGRNGSNDVEIIYRSGKDHVISSHFGYGIITFNIPWLFETEENVLMRVSGLPNFWKIGAHALEGIVETNWAPQTFTMNWKITEPDRLVHFKKHDPICFVQPITINQNENKVIVREIEKSPRCEAYRKWSESRNNFIASVKKNHETKMWQKHYFFGKSSDETEKFDEHLVKLKLFVEDNRDK